MKRITDLKVQVKNSKRVSVFLDGNYFCGLDLITLTKNRLKIGTEIDEQKLIEIQKEGEFQHAYEYSLNYITKSVKTKKQVYDKLTEKGYLGEIINGVISKLESYNFICDDEYTKKYINTYKDKKGIKLLRLELIKKGVDKDIIDKNLRGLDSQNQTAINIAKKYIKGKILDKKTYAKCYNYLLSKGFSYEDCDEATKFVFEND